jgi:hypothetical protein
MTRNEWLAQLAHGDSVLLRTKTREFPATAHIGNGNKIWVIYAVGDGIESAASVDRETGENEKTGYAIFQWQVPATTDVREGTKEPLQGAQRDDPPCYSQEDSAPQIASFWETAR